MQPEHQFQEVSSKADLITHLLEDHADTVFGSATDLKQEPIRVLRDSHRYGHFGPASAEHKAGPQVI